MFSLPVGSEFFITFLFLMGITFGALQVANVFKSRAVNAVISIAIGLFAASYTPFTTLLWEWLPALSWFFLIVFLIAFLTKIFKVKDHAQRTQTLVVSGIVLLIFLSVGITMMPQVPVIGTNNMLMIVGLLFLFILIWVASPHVGTGKEHEEGK